MVGERRRRELMLLLLVGGSPRAGGQSIHPAPQERKLAFEVATVRPSRPGSTGADWDSQGDRVAIRGYSLGSLIKAAYNLRSDAQVVGGPGWLREQFFDVSAKISDEEMAGFKGADADREEQRDVEGMLQTLLAERFKLRVRFAEAVLPGFELVVSRAKVKLFSDAVKGRSLLSQNGHLIAVATSMDELAEGLARMREVNERPITNGTGLAGRYDFEVRWTPARGGGDVPADATYPGLFTALQEQLGLRLKADRQPVRVVEVLAAELPVSD